MLLLFSYISNSAKRLSHMRINDFVTQWSGFRFPCVSHTLFLNAITSDLLLHDLRITFVAEYPPLRIHDDEILHQDLKCNNFFSQNSLFSELINHPFIALVIASCSASEYITSNYPT